MKFKIGDKVKIIAEDDSYFGEVGTIIKPARRGGEYDWFVNLPSNSNWPCKEKELEKVSKGRPKKEKPVKFIAIYDKTDRDPHKTFISKKELTDWIIEAKEDEDIIFDSIKVYPVGERLEIEVKVSFK